LPAVTDAPAEVPSADPRDALIREQAARLEVQAGEIAGQAERIAVLEAVVADLICPELSGQRICG
jgi:hypothetical protein